MNANVKPVAEITPAAEPRPQTRPASRKIVGPFYPLLVMVLTLLTWSCFQAYQLKTEGDNLQTARFALVQRLQAQQRVQTQLDSLARGVQGLADNGNAGAALLVEQLRRRGVTINAQNGAQR